MVAFGAVSISIFQVILPVAEAIEIAVPSLVSPDSKSAISEIPKVVVFNSSLKRTSRVVVVPAGGGDSVAVGAVVSMVVKFQVVLSIFPA
jgi:hypothetical protein